MPFYKDQFRCDVCGRFFVPDENSCQLVTPDSDMTDETWDVTCQECKARERGKEQKP